jgi:flagellar motor switch protein FliM
MANLLRLVHQNRNRSSRLASSMPSVLDTRTLGRPVHLLPGFASKLGDDLAGLFLAQLNRRYRASFSVGEVTIRHTDHAGSHPLPTRWQVYASDIGRMGVALDHRIVKTVFSYRYGLHHEIAASSGDKSPVQAPAYSQTEERLAASLGLLLARVLADCIDGCDGSTIGASPGSSGVSLLPASTPGTGEWNFHATVRESIHGVEGPLWLSVDDAWMARLLQKLAPRRRARSTHANAKQAPLTHALQLTLLAQLLKKEMPLGSLLDLRVGDVIPVRLGPTDVLIDESRLFTAVVAEHKGKLCLTSFEDAE